MSDASSSVIFTVFPASVKVQTPYTLLSIYPALTRSLRANATSFSNLFTLFLPRVAFTSSSLNCSFSMIFFRASAGDAEPPRSRKA